VIALVTVLRDKDWLGIMTALANVVDQFVLSSAPTAPSSRAWILEEVGPQAEAAGLRTKIIENFDDALRAVAELGETVVVTGSFHTVGDAMARLRVSPLAR
jgi:dihydrofolate synthase/folylpolyglutamate synthase